MTAGPPGIYRLTPVVRNYAWGSHEQLARLTGRPFPTQQPEAELWMGAHEEAPAGIVVDGAESTLLELVRSDPDGVLGADIAARFDGRLPFLLKVLAPEKALSIQVHPGAERARTAPKGVYVDRWSKPESLCAVTEFEAFVGMRTFDDVCRVVASLGLSHLSSLVAAASGSADPLKTLLASVLHADQSLAGELVAEVVAGCGRRRDLAACDAIVRVSEQFPGDIGLVVLLLMEHRLLQPGEYAFIDAGVLHSYVRGLAVELLANSDNVVRAGLTPKAVNVGELVEIVDTAAELVVERPNDDGRISVFPSDAPHFRLHRICSGGDYVDVEACGPRIVLSLNGSTTVECQSGSLTLQPGGACFIDAGVGTVRLRGTGTAYVASVG